MYTKELNELMRTKMNVTQVKGYLLHRLTYVYQRVNANVTHVTHVNARVVTHPRSPYIYIYIYI
jgi:hypothetical protein